MMYFQDDKFRNSEDGMREQLRWRPIEFMHEDYGACVLMHKDDPGYMEIGSNLNNDYDETLWTHFVPVPWLTEEMVRTRAVLEETAVCPRYVEVLDPDED